MFFAMSMVIIVNGHTGDNTSYKSTNGRPGFVVSGTRLPCAQAEDCCG